MGLIDIAKLNTEVEKLIAAQKDEMQEMKAKMSAVNEERFYQFMAAMKGYAETVAPIGKVKVFVGCYGDGYGNSRCFDVGFGDRRNRMTVSHMTTLGDYYVDFTVGYEAKYEDVICFGGRDVLNMIAKWYLENTAEFEKRLEDACIKKIKQKAEEANRRYQGVKDKYEAAVNQ